MKRYAPFLYLSFLLSGPVKVSGQEISTHVFFGDGISHKPASILVSIYGLPGNPRKVDSTGVLELIVEKDSLLLLISTSDYRTQKHVIRKGSLFDSVDVYSFQDCPVSNENTIAFPSALHQQLFGYWAIFPDTNYLPFNYYFPYNRTIFFFKDFEHVVLLAENKEYEMMYSLHEEQGVIWLQFHRIIDNDYPWLGDSAFARFKRRFPDRLFVKFIESNTILTSRHANTWNNLITLIRATGIVPEDINYQKLVAGREFYSSFYGYNGCLETSEDLRPIDRFNVYFIDSTRLIHSYKRDYDHLPLPLRYFDTTSTSEEHAITIVGNKVYGSLDGLRYPWFEIKASNGIRTMELKILDKLNEFNMLELTPMEDH